jgi:hypothetical protein
VTEHPGEQFPPDVDPDVEPGFQPGEYEEPQPEPEPDYDAEPGSHHVDPAEVEFGPEFARKPGQEHEHSFQAESAQDEGGHPLVEETMGRLDDLRDRPVGEHAEVYADLHERLQGALVEADAEQGDRS